MQNKEQRLAKSICVPRSRAAMEFSPFIFDSTFLRYEAEMCSVPSHHHSLTQAFLHLGKEGFICTFLAHLLKYVGRKSGEESSPLFDVYRLLNIPYFTRFYTPRIYYIKRYARGLIDEKIPAGYQCGNGMHLSSSYSRS